MLRGVRGEECASIEWTAALWWKFEVFLLIEAYTEEVWGGIGLVPVSALPKFIGRGG